MSTRMQVETCITRTERLAPKPDCLSLCYFVPSCLRGEIFGFDRFRRGSVVNSEWQFHSRRQTEPGGQPAHLFLGRGLHASYRVVDCGGDQVLEHFVVIAYQARIDGHALD